MPNVHELYDEARRNRRRFRAHVKPYLRSVFCVCCQGRLTGEVFIHANARRNRWMRLHAVEVMSSVAPVPVWLEGPLASRWRYFAGIVDGLDHEVYVSEVSLVTPRVHLDAVAAALITLGYDVKRARGALEAARDFVVCVRACDEVSPGMLGVDEVLRDTRAHDR